MGFNDFIPPFSDFGFKNLFGKEGAATENLIVLLNAILHEQLGFERIVAVKLNPTEKKGENPDRKTTFYDIHCTTSNGHRIIVEMQNRWNRNFPDRMLFYVAEGLVHQDTRKSSGDSWDFSFDPVIGLALCNFTMPRFENEPVVFFDLRDRKTNKEYNAKIGIIHIHLPEFKEEMEECRTELERIIYSLKNMDSIHKMEKIPFSENEGDFYARIANMSQVSALTMEERVEYDRWRKHVNDRLLEEKEIFDEAKAEGRAEGIAEGRAEGIIEGRAEGIAEGRAEGRIEGRAEGIEEGEKRKAWEMAEKMLRKGMAIESISEFTDLTIEELNKRYQK